VVLGELEAVIRIALSISNSALSRVGFCVARRIRKYSKDAFSFKIIENGMTSSDEVLSFTVSWTEPNPPTISVDKPPISLLL
jgi:hypothetical protein